MTKTEIIARTVNDSSSLKGPVDDVLNDETGYSEDEIVAILQVALKNATPHEQVRTCANFVHLNVECCETCHHHHPHFEMALIEIESGGDAWICCALDRALNPQKRAERESSPQWKAIAEMLDGDVVDLEVFLQVGLPN